MTSPNTPIKVGDQFLKSDYDNYRINGERHRCDYTQRVEITKVDATGFGYKVIGLVSETNAPPMDFPGRRSHTSGTGSAIFAALEWFSPVGPTS